MATKPTRKRPAKKSASAKKSKTTGAATKAGEAKPKRQYTRRTPITHQMSVYYEDSDGTLQPMGAYDAAKAEEALEGYLKALEPTEFASAIEAETYAVDSPKGLVRLTAGQKIEITTR